VTRQVPQGTGMESTVRASGIDFEECSMIGLSRFFRTLNVDRIL
jgi:hypothetical protein